jgi:GTP-binding protein YchF
VKLGIIGLPGSGKTTVFRALTGGVEGSSKKSGQEPGMGTVKVRDERLDFLATHHRPKKVTPAQVEYLDIAGLTGEGKGGRTIGDKTLAYIRPMDALIHCVRFFDSPMLPPSDPEKEFQAVNEEMALSDLAVVEKRMERVAKDLQRGRKELAREHELLTKATELLEQGLPLLMAPELCEAQELKGFAFLSAKPRLVILNAGEGKSRDDIRAMIEKFTVNAPWPNTRIDGLYADAEAEIATLPEEEAAEFLQDLELEEGAKDRIVKTSFDLLNLMVFFTAGEPEVRAWQVPKGVTALKAAGTIHSDIERGFIRAEVVAYSDFKAAGNMQAAHKAGKVRLEGKDYIVADGDIIYFRFNV